MTYNEWKSELETYLIDMPYGERQKVFSYFSEMYADKREAGFTEKEIIAEFGAPYDAAQRVLGRGDEDPAPVRTPAGKESKPDKSADNTWLFVLVCVVCAVPVFCIVMAAAGITVGLCVAPISIIAGGASSIGGAVGFMVAGGAAGAGVCSMGLGVIVCGVGVMLCPIAFGAAGLLWKGLKKLYTLIKDAICGKENL